MVIQRVNVQFHFFQYRLVLVICHVLLQTYSTKMYKVGVALKEIHEERMSYMLLVVRYYYLKLVAYRVESTLPLGSWLMFS